MNAVHSLNHIVSEECLRKEADKRNSFWSNINEVLDESLVSEVGIRTIRDEVDVIDLIDSGNHGGMTGSK